MSPQVSIIVALSENRVIGSKNTLPWDIPEDMQHFRTLTKGHVVIMGRKTYESIGRPLPQRINIVISSQKGEEQEGLIWAYSLQEALEKGRRAESKELFIIGGGTIYEQALEVADKLYLTKVHAHIDGDTTFPAYEHIFTKELSRREGKGENPTYTFFELVK